MNRFLVLLSLPLLVSLHCRQSAAIDISLKLEKNDAFMVISQSTSEVDQQSGFRSGWMHSVVTIVYDQRVDSVFPNGNYRIAMKYNSITIEKHPSSNVTDLDEILNALNRIMERETFHLIITPKWKVLEIANLERIQQVVVDTITKDRMFEANILQIYKSIDNFMKENFSLDKFKDMFQYVSGAFPDKPVRIGSKWHTDIKCGPTNDPIAMSIDYQLKEIRNGFIKIGLKSWRKQDNRATPEDQGGAQVSGAMEGPQEGDLFIERENCWLSEMSLTQQMNGTVRAVFSNQPGSMNLRTNVKIQTTMTTVKLQ